MIFTEIVPLKRAILRCLGFGLGEFLYIHSRGVFMTMMLKIENPTVLDLIKQLESLQMLSIVNSLEKPKVDWRMFRGSVSKQSREEVDKQLKELRSEWERV